MYQIIKTEGRAKRAQLETVHGTIQTPVFMNVGTAAAIKGLSPRWIYRKLKPRWNCPTRITSM